MSVVVTSYNTCADLKSCLESVYAETQLASLEVIVVDNASVDGSGAMVRAEFPQVVLVENAENRGFAGACNQGMRRAQGRFILILNPDTVILEGAIDRTLDFAESRPDAGLVGCKVLSRDGALQYTCHMYPRLWNLLLSLTGLPRLFPQHAFFGRAWLQGWDHCDVRDVEWIAGCFMLARREAIQDVGLMDEMYFMFVEDIDWCRRFHDCGWRVLYYPEARVTHLLGQSGKDPDRDLRFERRKNLVAYFGGHRGAGAAFAANGIYAAADLGNILFDSTAVVVEAAMGRKEGRALKRLAVRWRTLVFHLRQFVFGRPFGGWVRLGKRGLKAALSALFLASWIAPRNLLRRLSGKADRRLIVVYYHGVSPAGRRRFARQMDSILKVAKPFSVAGEAAPADSGPFVAVTFDDAFESVADNALPEMGKRGIPATIFAPSAHLGRSPGWPMKEGAPERRERVMDESRLAFLAGNGFTIGSHTASHSALGELSENDARAELTASKAVLEAATGRIVDLVALPYGSCSPGTARLAREAGYRRAFTIEPRETSVDSDEFLVGRFQVLAGDSRLEFWLKIRGAYGWQGGVMRFSTALQRRFGRKGDA